MTLPMSAVSPLRAKPSTSFVQVNPTTAKRWLARNTTNRNLRKTRVEQYARDMRAGNWLISNDALCFDTAGYLLNGQHRLNAVVKSGCTVTFLVARNVPADSQSVMDAGVARTAGDMLNLAGHREPIVLAAAAKLLSAVQTGAINGDDKNARISHLEIAEMVDAHPALSNSVVIARSVTRVIDCSPTVLSVAHYLIAEANGTEWADAFLHLLASRTDQGPGSPILALDARLRQFRRDRIRIETRELLSLLLRTHNHLVQNAHVTFIRVSTQRAGSWTLPNVARRAAA